MTQKPKRPRDVNQLAKRIVDIATGEVEDREQTPEEQGKDPAAVSLGRRGGLKGGKARSKSLTEEQRSEIARRAALARWTQARADNFKLTHYPFVRVIDRRGLIVYR
jgi:hypothetical protein